MPTPKKGPRLGGSASHQRHIVANLATALFEHGRITTTEVRARTLRPVAEKLITKAKKAPLGTVESLHHRRQVLKTITNKSVVHLLFTEIGPKMAERPGGYTRITKLGPRKGDNAAMAVIELVQEAYKPSEKKPAKKAAAPAPKAEEKPAAEAVDQGDEVDETHVGDDTEQAATDESASESASARFADLEYGDDVAEALEDGAAPSEAFTIKGNKDSGKYHTPDSQWYDQTIAEVWFTTEEAAEEAGFVKAG